MNVILSANRVGKTAVVALQGEIDLQNSGEVRRELLAKLGDGCSVVVDLSKVEYIDSSGVASLIEAYQTARQLGVHFSLAAVSTAVMRVLKLARLDEVFVISAGVNDALGGG